MIIEPDTGRKFPRFHCDHHANLEFISGSYDNCWIKNVSLTGMYSRWVFPQQAGEYCLVNLLQTEITTDVNFHASAKVVWKNDEGIGIEFTSMSMDHYMFLQTTLFNKVEDLFIIGQIFPENYPYKVTDELPISHEAMPSNRACWFFVNITSAHHNQISFNVWSV